jgi:hypothetical protein
MADDVTAALDRVEKIDLSPISVKLQYEDPAKWTRETLADAECTYRRFLALNLLYPTERIAVNKVIDEYWHQHILDTQKYAEDCQAVFGYFLHHYPYFGLGGEEDKRQNLEAFAVTQEIWAEAFGEPMVAKAKLTLDKVLAGSAVEGTAKQEVYVAPQGCKSGQHCPKIIVPGDFDPEEPTFVVLTEEPSQ